MIKIAKCNHCGNMVAFLEDTGVPVICCGEPMEVLEANTVDAAAEKHVPEITTEGNTVTVKVGSVEHPMTSEHYITHIILETAGGLQIKTLTPEDAPEAAFPLAQGDTVTAAYEYCSLHGLWKK